MFPEKEHNEFLQKIKRERSIVLFLQIFLILGFLSTWEIAAHLKWIDPFIFSQPSRIYKAFIWMIKDGSLYKHILVTAGETIVGFVLGTMLGTLLAVILWWFPMVDKILAPYLVILNALPKTALAPILIVWLGNNMKSIIVTALLTSVIVTVISVLTGFLQVEEEKLKLIDTLSGDKKQKLLLVVLPASIPTIIAALKINVGLSFVGVIVGEFLVAKAGLGYLIVYGSQIFKMDWVLLSVLILAILAALLYQLILTVEKKFKSW